MSTAPTGAEQSSAFRALKNKLLARVTAANSRNTENAARRRIIRGAALTQDYTKLERLDKHFDMDPDLLGTTYEALELAGADLTDNALFECVLQFVDLTQTSYPQPLHLVDFIPLVKEHHDRIEQLAHCVNMCSTDEDIATVDATVAMFKAPDQHELIKAPAIQLLARSTTPVSDIRLVASDLYNDSLWEAQERLEDYDQQTISLLANALRANVPSRTLLSEINSNSELYPFELSQRRTAEFAAMILSVRDVLSDDDEVGILYGTNGAAIDSAMLDLFATHPDKLRFDEDPLPIDTDEDHARTSALLRFMLTVNDPNDLYGILEYVPDKTEYFERRKITDMRWVDLICRRNNRDDADALVHYYNMRGADTEGAAEYLNDTGARALRDGML